MGLGLPIFDDLQDMCLLLMQLMQWTAFFYIAISSSFQLQADGCLHGLRVKSNMT